MKSTAKMINIWRQIPPAQRRGGNLDCVLQLLLLSAICWTYRRKICISDVTPKGPIYSVYNCVIFPMNKKYLESGKFDKTFKSSHPHPSQTWRKWRMVMSPIRSLCLWSRIPGQQRCLGSERPQEETPSTDLQDSMAPSDGSSQGV